MQKTTVNNEKGIAGIVLMVVLFLVILGFGGFYYVKNAYDNIGTNPAESIATAEPVATTAPTPEGEVDTSKWKVYEDKKNMFSFKYPETLTLVDYKEGTNSGVALETKQADLMGDGENVAVYRSTILKNESLKADELALKMIGLEKQGDTNQTFSDIYAYFIGGKEGYQYRVKTEDSERKVLFVTLTGNDILKVETIEPLDKSEYSNQTDEITETFRFMVLGAKL